MNVTSTPIRPMLTPRIVRVLHGCAFAVSLISTEIAARAQSSPSSPPGPAEGSKEAPIRVALRARAGGADRLTPLRYIGGFETKTLVYETLVRRGADGRIAPGLASRWAISPDRKAIHFELREGARFHDGTPVTPEAVRIHFKRWVGLPEHAWLNANARILDVEVESERGFKVTMDQPYALLADLCAINPCAIVGPSARDWEGEFVRPMGTGPFRFIESLDEGRRWRLARHGSQGPDLEVRFYPRGRDTAPLDALLAGDIDAFVGGWDEDLPARRLEELERDDRFRVLQSPGSSMVYLSFLLADGPSADPALRRRIAAAIDRKELIQQVEGGRADASSSWAAPALAFWPRPLPRNAPEPTIAALPAWPGPPIKIAASRREGRASRVAAEVVRQLQRAGIPAQLVANDAERVTSAPASRRSGVGDSGEFTARPPAVGTVTPIGPESGESRAAANLVQRELAKQADLRVEITHGSPYDPHQALVARFGPSRPGERSRSGVDPRLHELVLLAAATPDEMECMPIYARIQELMDSEALIVPLYAPWRVAVHSAKVEGIRLSTDVYSVDLTELRRTRGP